MNLDKKGLIGTSIFHILVALLLIFFGFSYPDPPPEEEGILVNFGSDFDGFGEIEPAGDDIQAGNEEPMEEPAEEAVDETIPETSAPPVETVPTPVEESTQDFEESPVKEDKPTPEEIRQQEIERQERIQREQEQEARREAERLAEEERKKKEEQRERLNQLGRNALGNRSTGTENTSQGITEGSGNQGSPGGQPGVDNYEGLGGLGEGISYGLGNRRSRGAWPKPVLSDCEVTSRIIIKVQIDVDSEGNVTGQPRIIESTFQDDCIYRAIIRAARMAKFNRVNKIGKERGWIRYIIEP